jgi:hypothetical protein
MECPPRSLLRLFFAFGVRFCSAIAATMSCPFEPHANADMLLKSIEMLKNAVMMRFIFIVIS